jgi:1-pyrroline-5-carboxylate dehydrogenase
MFMHKNWKKTDLIDKIRAQAAKRSLKDLTIGPVLSWGNEAIKGHIDAILELDGAELLFGGVPLKNHSIPAIYGSYEPTAIKVPLKHFRGKKKRDLLTTELFGPFQIITEYGNNDLDFLLETINNLPHHLTAACVSNDRMFVDKVMGNTVNGTQYEGLRARTTGAPQNHWFGPSGDPRGAGIGTAGAI